MDRILEIRQTIKDFFSRYDLFLMPALKFLLAFFVFMLINRNYGYMELLNHVFIVVILALLCAVLPVTAIVVIGFILIVLHSFAASLVIGIVTLAVIIILLILILRFAPGDSLAAVLTPIAFLLHIPAVIPVSLGMIRGKSSVLAGISGVALYCYLDGLPSAVSYSARGEATAVEVAQRMIDRFINHEQLILSLIVFTAVTLIVNIIRRSVTKYTYAIAVASGAVAFFVLRLVGSRFLEVSLNVSREFLGALFSAVICLVIAFFMHCVDYKRTQLLQFEDEEYVYYVKAVPKKTVEDFFEDEYEDTEDDPEEEDGEEFELIDEEADPEEFEDAVEDVK